MMMERLINTFCETLNIYPITDATNVSCNTYSVLEIRKKPRLSEWQMWRNLGQLAFYFSQKLVA